MKHSILAKGGALLPVAALMGVLFSQANAQVAVTCPPGPNQLTVTVTSQVSFDTSTQLYTYKYTVANSPTSAQEVEGFRLDFATPVSNFTNPQGWTDGLFRRRSILSWGATVAAPLPPGTADDSRVPPGIAQIKPGQSLAGFSFQSPKPPGPVKYYVTGFVDVPPQDGEEGAETLLEKCPQSAGNILDLAVVGTTQGPVNFIPVDIQIKPTATPPVPVNPRDKGVTPVAILGTASFDVTTVDQSSVRFGPASASPQKDSGHLKDVNNDGILDLVFQFPTQSIGVRCNDTALFLTGKIKSGTSIQGAEAIHTVGCKF